MLDRGYNAARGTWMSSAIYQKSPLLGTFVDGPIGIYDEFGNQNKMHVIASLAGSVAWFYVGKMIYDKVRGYQ
jgi:hypothetical protein